MSNELPPQVQNQIAQLQQVQQQAQVLAAQKAQVDLMLKETESALEELSKLDENATIYQSIGGILIKTEHGKTVDKLEEKRDTLNLRLQTLDRQEERIQKRFTQLQEQLKQSMGQSAR